MSLVKKIKLVVGLSAAIALLPVLSPAAAFLKLGDIKGESTDEGFKDQIVIESFSFGVSTSVQPAGSLSGSSRGRASASFQDIVVTKPVDKSSPRLMLACADGTNFGDVVLSITRSSGQAQDPPSTYLMYELKDVRISSYSTSGDGDEALTESVSLNFSAIKITYVPQDSTGKPDLAGKVEASWNLVTSRPEFRSETSSIDEPVTSTSKPASTGTEVTVE